MASQLWPMATELHVGESGGMLPQKILNFRPSESDSEALQGTSFQAHFTTSFVQIVQLSK